MLSYLSAVKIENASFREAQKVGRQMHLCIPLSSTYSMALCDQGSVIMNSRGDWTETDLRPHTQKE